MEQVKRQGIAELVPGGSTPPFALGANRLENHWTFNPADAKARNRVEIPKPEMSLQDRGYRLDKLSKLNLTSPVSGVPFFFKQQFFW